MKLHKLSHLLFLVVVLVRLNIIPPLILKMPKPTTTGDLLNLNQEIKQVRLKILLKLSQLILN